MHKNISIASQICEQASDIPRRYFRGQIGVDYKSDESPVTRADKETESFIRDAIRREFPGQSIIGEEFESELHDSDYEWIIDPIDGTRSFVSGMPLYGMLLAQLNRGRPEIGIVRMPELEESYAGDGQETRRNSTDIIHVSDTTSLEDAIVYVNEGEKLLKHYPELFQRLSQTGRVTRLGYDCYPHVLLAAGHVDLVVDFDLKPYDYLPLVPVIEGAGGLITDWQEQSLHLESNGQVVSAATPELLRQALEILNP